MKILKGIAVFCLIGGLLALFIYTYYQDEWNPLRLAVKHFTPLATIFGLLIAVYKIFEVGGRISLNKKAIFNSNCKTCIGLMKHLKRELKENCSRDACAIFIAFCEAINETVRSCKHADDKDQCNTNATLDCIQGIAMDIRQREKNSSHKIQVEHHKTELEKSIQTFNKVMENIIHQSANS